MPIRKSKVTSSEAFRVHRKARLSGLRIPSDGDAESHSAPGADPDAKTEAPHPNRPDCVAGDRPASAPQPDAERWNTPDSRPQQPIHRTREGWRGADGQCGPELADQLDADRRRKTPAGKVPEQLRLQMALAYPVAGASPTFDQLVGVQNERVAFRLVLGKALETYAAAVADGTFVEAPTTYPESPEIAKTSRMFPKAAFSELAKVLNPTGLLSDRAMGTMIGRRALAAFVARDKGPV